MTISVSSPDLDEYPSDQIKGWKVEGRISGLIWLTERTVGQKRRFCMLHEIEKLIGNIGNQ